MHRSNLKPFTNALTLLDARIIRQKARLVYLIGERVRIKSAIANARSAFAALPANRPKQQKFTRLLLTAIRRSGRSMTTRDLAAVIVADRAIAPDNTKDVAKIVNRVRIALSQQRAKGVVLSEYENGKAFWSVA